jgi:hypothetical protein
VHTADTPPFIDGGTMIAPRGGFFTRDGTWAVENEGVGPDIDVENWPKDVIAGRDPQLERGVAEALKALAAAPPSRLRTEPAPPTWGRRPVPDSVPTFPAGCRQTRPGESMLRHLRLAVRTLLKTPFVTGVASPARARHRREHRHLSLFDRFAAAAAGRGARRPRELPRQGRSPDPRSAVRPALHRGVQLPDVRDLERLQTSFTGLAAHKQFGANVAARGDTRSLDGELVSGSYFPTLGLQPAAGRLLTPADDATPGAHPVVVLSHGYWTSRFAQDPTIVGQPIVVNNTALTVVGVAPPGFEGTTLGLRPGLFVPISMRGVIQPGWEGFENRRRYWSTCSDG